MSSRFIITDDKSFLYMTLLCEFRSENPDTDARRKNKEGNELGS